MTILRAITSSRARNGRLLDAWLMAKATFDYTYAHGCGFWYSLRAAAVMFAEKMR